MSGEGVQVEAMSLSFGDESFDVVIALALFEHIPEPERVLGGIVRLLRPEGMALYLDV